MTTTSSSLFKKLGRPPKSNTKKNLDQRRLKTLTKVSPASLRGVERKKEGKENLHKPEKEKKTKQENKMMQPAEVKAGKAPGLDDLDQAILNKLLAPDENLTWRQFWSQQDVPESTGWDRKARLIRSPALREQFGRMIRADLGYWYQRHRQEKGMRAVELAYELAGIYDRKPSVQVQQNVVTISKEFLESKQGRIREVIAEAENDPPESENDEVV